MKYARFEDLPVWQAAADLAAQLFDWTNQRWFRGQGDLANQLQRAGLSISNNIAEGFERGTTSELLQFLYIARGSAGEVRSMLGVIERMLQEGRGKEGGDFKSEISNLKSEISNFKSEISNLKSEISNLKSSPPDLTTFLSRLAGFKSGGESISRQLRGWANSLQNSPSEGPRHLNDRTRSVFRQRQQRSAVEEQLAASQEELRRKLEAARERRNEEEGG